MSKPIRSIPVRPQPTHTSIAFCKTQQRYAHRPISDFPWNSFHLKMTSHGYVVGSDWAMTTFDERRDDQFFDSKRLQTIDEGTEVRFFHPFDPLKYSSNCTEMDVLSQLRQVDIRERKSLVRRVFEGAKRSVTRAVYLVHDLGCRAFSFIKFYGTVPSSTEL